MRKLVVLVLCSVALAGCGASESSPEAGTTKSPRTTTIAAQRAYAGLGAAVAAFKADNNTVRGSELVEGVAYYSVDATSSDGRVSAFSVEIKTSPRMDDATRMGLVMGTLLPDDVRQVRQTSTCIDLRSRKLRNLLGRAYAHVMTDAGSDAAQVASASAPSC